MPVSPVPLEMLDCFLSPIPKGEVLEVFAVRTSDTDVLAYGGVEGDVGDVLLTLQGVG